MLFIILRDIECVWPYVAINHMELNNVFIILTVFFSLGTKILELKFMARYQMYSENILGVVLNASVTTFEVSLNDRN
jgi:hypothetical protein